MVSLPPSSSLARYLTPDAVRQAREEIAPHVHRTPMLRCSALDLLTGMEIHLKLECWQKTGSFKPRGALNAIAHLDADALRRGVLAASAGNHAQGLAFAASARGVPVKVVMPANTPPSKIAATRSMGAEIVLHGAIFDDALERALEIRDASGMTFVHPATDPFVVAGAGTVGLEILEDLPEIDALLCPVGGGGLLCGIGTVVRERFPHARLFGVCAAGADAMARSFTERRVVRLERGASIAEGIAGRSGTQETLEIMMSGLVEGIVSVTDARILEALLLLLTRAKILTEGAGAAPLAALLAGAVALEPGSRVVLVLSGGNVDLDALAGWIRHGPPSEA